MRHPPPPKPRKERPDAEPPAPSGADDGDDSVSKRKSGIIKCAPADLLGKPGMKLGANDGPVEDYLDLVEGWEEVAGHSLMSGAQPPDSMPQAQAARNALLDRVAAEFEPAQMRELGESLLRLADALDQSWDPAQVRSRYHWITRAGRIERNSITLAQVAIRVRGAAERRKKHLPAEFLGEPAWDMLLELFVQFSGGAQISTKSLCIASGLPDTSAIRLIDRLEEAGLVERATSETDKRVTLVSLSRQGVTAVGAILMELS
jgi:DNA-binding MarR family transcriptional regulator